MSMKLPKSVAAAFREFGRQGGKIGGARTARGMTPEQLSERARNAANAKHRKRKENARKISGK